jgi:8-oxo-dGTP pyrophosphatase MutT (NUDIX family)
MRPWKTVKKEPVQDYRIFTLRRDRCVSPRTGEEHDFVVLEAPDWVNVVARTDDDQVILIEQFRFGSGQVTLEIPGGMIDPGEAPVAAGARELLEETGYSARSYELIGYVEPNPAIQTNRCYTVLAEGATKSAEQSLDEKEDIGVKLWPFSDVPKLLAEGRIRHALVWAAFHQLLLHK